MWLVVDPRDSLYLLDIPFPVDSPFSFKRRLPWTRRGTCIFSFDGNMGISGVCVTDRFYEAEQREIGYKMERESEDRKEIERKRERERERERG